MEVDDAIVWFRNALSNLKIAKLSLEVGEYARCVENSQQAAEKAAKALLILAGKYVEEHRISQLFYDTFGIAYEDMERVSDLLFKLEKHWLKSKYPIKKGDELWDPLKNYTRKDAEEALKNAEKVIELITKFAKREFDLELMQ